MKKIIVLLFVLTVLFCSCAKKDSGFDLLTIPDGTPVSLLNPHTMDVISYQRDDKDVESLLTKINALEPSELTSVESVDLEAETPFVTVYVEREQLYIFRIWSMGEGECAATLYTTGTEQNIYFVTFNDEDIASLTEKVYASFEG